MRWSFGKNGSRLSPIGLDIGRCGVRVAQIAWHRRLPQRLGDIRTACWEWPARALARTKAGLTEAFQDSAERREIATRIRRLLKQCEFRGKAAVVGLSSPEVELHALELPSVSDSSAKNSLRQAAHWELERLMSFEKGEVECDYWFLPPSKSATTTALGVAARKSDVEAVGRLCHDAGLECRRVDAGVCALARFAACLRAPPGADAPPCGADDVWGVLDLGHRQSRLALCVDATPVVVRAFDTGIAKWIQWIAEALEITPEAAEIHLRDHGVQPIGRGMRAPIGTQEPAAPSAQLGGIIRNILRPEFEILCNEIERSFRYTQQCYPGPGSAQLVLVGGGSEVKNLAIYLRERLGIAVYTAAERWPVLNPTAGNARIRQVSGVMSCAVGLAFDPGDAHDRH